VYNIRRGGGGGGDLENKVNGATQFYSCHHYHHLQNFTTAYKFTTNFHHNISLRRFPYRALQQDVYFQIMTRRQTLSLNKGTESGDETVGSYLKR